MPTFLRMLSVITNRLLLLISDYQFQPEKQVRYVSHLPFLVLPYFSGRETVKAYGLSCCNHYLCHVEGLLLKERFLNFGAVGALIRPFGASIYTPLPGLFLVTLTGQPFAPWVPVVPVLTLFFGCLRRWSKKMFRFCSSYCTNITVLFNV